jgi:hypothetical protein
MLSNQALEELKEACRNDEKAMGKVFNLIEEGVTSSKDIVNNGGGGNIGAVGINKQILDAILLRQIPNSSNIATYAYRAINRLEKLGGPFSPELTSYLSDLEIDLKAKSLDDTAIKQSLEDAEKESKNLERLLARVSNAIYVYSYPTYLRAGTVEDPELYWFKIGFTDKEVGSRILSQARQTAMPEDPVIVRVYHKPGALAQDLESKFHKTLDAFKQNRSAHKNQRAGKEWFATDLEKLDAIADLLELTIEA